MYLDLQQLKVTKISLLWIYKFASGKVVPNHVLVPRYLKFELIALHYFWYLFIFTT